MAAHQPAGESLGVGGAGSVSGAEAGGSRFILFERNGGWRLWVIFFAAGKFLTYFLRVRKKYKRDTFSIPSAKMASSSSSSGGGVKRSIGMVTGEIKNTTSELQQVDAALAETKLKVNNLENQQASKKGRLAALNKEAASIDAAESYEIYKAASKEAKKRLYAVAIEIFARAMLIEEIQYGTKYDTLCSRYGSPLKVLKTTGGVYRAGKKPLFHITEAAAYARHGIVLRYSL